MEARNESFSSVLHRSASSLLIISRLSEDQKNDLLRNIENNSEGNFISNPTYDGPPIVADYDAEGGTRFVWHSSIKLWIINNALEGSGCPANQHIIETPEGRKQVLISYFWRKLIEACYPE